MKNNTLRTANQNTSDGIYCSFSVNLISIENLFEIPLRYVLIIGSFVSFSLNLFTYWTKIKDDSWDELRAYIIWYTLDDTQNWTFIIPLY